MKQTTIQCDRCGCNILEGGSILDVQAGSLRQRFSAPLDLCQSCSERFDDFVRAGHQAAHCKPWPALEYKADGLPMPMAPLA